jgi:DNA ligase 1
MVDVYSKILYNNTILSTGVQMSDPCYRVVADLENHSSRINKEAIVLAQAQAGNDEFFEGVRLALDPMVTFGLKQIPEKKDADGAGLSWEAFTLIITGFVSRAVTGNTARDMVTDMMKSATKAEWNGWYRRILIKDLRCGTSEKTVNKVVEKEWPEYAVPIFSCQLAHDSANHESKVSGRKLIEVKLDGVRVITVVYPDGRVDQYSRNGKELVNFPHVKEQFKFVASIGGHFDEPMVFDGEIMSSSFQDLMKQVHRKSDVKSNDAVLNLFDILTLEEFERGKSKTPQRRRSEMLAEWYAVYENAMPNVEILSHELVDLDTEQGQAQYKAINARAVAAGYEGIMIKDPDAGYQCKRSVAWLKLKPFIEVSLTVTAVEEGTGKNVGKLGAFVCEGVDDGRRISVNVGSGFSDSLRDAYFVGRDSILGKVVEVRADAITQNQDGTYSLRFPRFLRFRGFEVGEKI